ncbi:type II secretion system protein M [Ferrimonas pelagia]
MNAYWEQAQQWWFSRAASEQRLMTVAGPLLLLALLYFGIWTPVANSVEQAEMRVRAGQNALNEVKRDANRYVTLAGAGGATQNRGGSLSQVASRSAGSAGIRIARMQPQGDKLQLWVEDTQFETLMAWLEQLSQQQGVSVEALDVTVAQQPGLIQVRRLQIAQP